MKAGLSISLGIVLVGLATLNVITMLESSRSSQTPQNHARQSSFIVAVAICSSVYSQ